MLKNKDLIGRLLSGLYTFVDGHIYYNNNVIKIRYDLIKSVDSHRYKENEIFDSIKNKKLTQMHVRGSSRKEAVDFSQKLVILFLFED